MIEIMYTDYLGSLQELKMVRRERIVLNWCIDKSRDCQACRYNAERMTSDTGISRGLPMNIHYPDRPQLKPVVVS